MANPRTNTQRFSEAVAYIRKNIDANLANQFNGMNKEAAGKEISLKGHYYSAIGWNEQHQAVRALLLCQHRFLGAFAGLEQSKNFFKSKSRSTVNKYIAAYAKDKPSLEKLARKAETYSLRQTQLGWNQRKRGDNNVGGSAIICYSGVLLWLFQAGFITLQWYRDNNGMNANDCNTILGNGRRWDTDHLDQIPRGWIWNFQGYRKEICHWGVSLGNGRAAGTNNEENAREGNNFAEVDFETGGKLYGKFSLNSQYEVLKLKYGKASRKVEGGGATDFEEVTGVETKLFVINPMTKTFG